MDFYDFSDGPGSGEHLFLGDEQWGNSASHLTKFKKLTHYINSKKNITASNGGDMLETICPDDKRFSLEGHSIGKVARISAQVDFAVEQYEPIADRMLWFISGNHEAVIDYIMVPAVEVARRIGHRSFGTASWMIKAKMPCFNILDWHGDGNVGSRHQDPQVRYENECRAIKEKLARQPVADCHAAIMHHIHKVRIRPPTKIDHVIGMDSIDSCTTDGNTYMVAGKHKLIPEHHRWYASSGSILGTHAIGNSTYAERRGLGASTMGMVKAVWKNDKFIGLEEIRL